MASKTVILVTGAGSGLGRSLCKLLAGPDRRLLATDRDLAAATETAALANAIGEVDARRLDVTSEQDIDELLRQESNPVAILINNAGLQHVERIETFGNQRWSTLVNVMLSGSARMIAATVPGMRTAGYGRIINIGSIHSLVASPFKSAYVSAKHGLLGLTKTIALESADVDITVNAICPSYIRTPLVEKQIAEQAAAHGISESEVIQEIMLKPMPKKAFVTPEEVAGAIEFLVSSAARNITGQNIVIDGGWTAR